MRLINKKINSLAQNGTDLVRASMMAAFMLGATGYVAASETQNDALDSTTKSVNEITGITPFHYLWYSGSTFSPVRSVAQYGYKGSGCIYRSGGTEPRIAHKVLLPEGALIHYVRMYSYDDDSSYMLGGYLTTYDAAGNYNELTNINSVDGGYSSVLSPLINYTVNNYTSPMNMIINLGDSSGSDLAFCGVRIAYTLPIVDLIFEDGFE